MAPPIAVDEQRTAVPSPPLPPARGPLSAHVIDHLTSSPRPLEVGPRAEGRPWWDDDLQLALYVCYELHYRSFAGVDEDWEWHPDLLRFRSGLEHAFENGVRSVVAVDSPVAAAGPHDVEATLWGLARGGRGKSLSAEVASHATLEQVRELAVHRSAYQLKEADPHTWAIPRIAGGAKADMVQIQADEYGGGREPEMHSSLFAVTMAELGLDNGYGIYLDRLPGFTLATVNLISMFGLHRRLRGALVGHLAIFEMTSVTPMGRYSKAMERLGLGDAARRFYDVHVLADDHHQHVAARMAARLASDEPSLCADIVFGARAVMEVEALFTREVLDHWGRQETSLLRPLPSPEG